MYNFASYDEWVKSEFDSLSESEPFEIKCPKCKGEGVIYDTCHCCDQETEEDCDYCGMTGLVSSDDINTLHEAMAVFTKVDYLESVKATIEKLVSYTDNTQKEILESSNLTYEISEKGNLIITGIKTN